MPASPWNGIAGDAGTFGNCPVANRWGASYEVSWDADIPSMSSSLLPGTYNQECDCASACAALDTACQWWRWDMSTHTCTSRIMVNATSGSFTTFQPWFLDSNITFPGTPGAVPLASHPSTTPGSGNQFVCRSECTETMPCLFTTWNPQKDTCASYAYVATTASPYMFAVGVPSTLRIASVVGIPQATGSASPATPSGTVGNGGGTYTNSGDSGASYSREIDPRLLAIGGPMCVFLLLGVYLVYRYYQRRRNPQPVQLLPHTAVFPPGASHPVPVMSSSSTDKLPFGAWARPPYPPPPPPPPGNQQHDQYAMLQLALAESAREAAVAKGDDIPFAAWAKDDPPATRSMANLSLATWARPPYPPPPRPPSGNQDATLQLAVAESAREAASSATEAADVPLAAWSKDELPTAAPVPSFADGDREDRQQETQSQIDDHDDADAGPSERNGDENDDEGREGVFVPPSGSSEEEEEVACRPEDVEEAQQHRAVEHEGETSDDAVSPDHVKEGKEEEGGEEEESLRPVPREWRSLEDEAGTELPM
ncbi:hypothetical protein HKX48_000652 [Thoreauomyces humboldtii]|nr:hypothetical protein HKX48_000652 [Thoreauomyces humboldtii]